MRPPAKAAMTRRMRAYEFQLNEKDGHRRLHMYASDSTEPVMQHARELLEEDDLEYVEVKLDGVLLFTVSR